VIDENGTMRAFMNDDGIFYYDENGTGRVGMDANGIVYMDENFNLVWGTDCAPNC
jgi:hypothetical protein